MGKNVELTNVELANLLQGCNLIQSKFDLIASLDFRMTKIINTLNPHIEEYQEAVNKVRKKYRAEIDEESDEPEVKGNEEEPKFKVKEGKEEEFKEELEKLDKEKVEIQIPTVFHIDDFVDEEGKQLKFKEKKLGGITYLIDPIIEV